MASHGIEARHRVQDLPLCHPAGLASFPANALYKPCIPMDSGATQGRRILRSLLRPSLRIDMANLMLGSPLSDRDVHRLVIDEATLQVLLQRQPPDAPHQQAAWLTAVAWHLRQRDTSRASTTAGLAEQVLQQPAVGEQPERHPLRVHAAGPSSGQAVAAGKIVGHLRARLQLVQAEALWLCGDLMAAQRLAQALCAFVGDPLEADIAACIRSDACMLLANLAHDLGAMAQATAHSRLACEWAKDGQDGQRLAVAEGLQALLSIHLGAAEAEATWGAPMRARLDDADAVSALFACQFHGMLSARQRRYADSIAHFTKAAELARQVGQQRRGIVACVNASASFGNLYDFQSALEWTQRALDLARPAAWPAPLCMCLAELGGLLKKLNRFNEARATLDEAMGLLQALGPMTIGSMIQLHSAGLALGQDQPDRALREFEQLCLQQPPPEMAVRLNAQIGYGQALLALGRADEAMQTLQRAADMAHQTDRPSMQFQALKSLGDANAGLARQSPDFPQDRALAFYRQALQVAASIGGFVVPKELLDAMAGEHARLDQPSQAYAVAVQAMQARKQADAQAAAQRGIAMATRNAAERLQAEHRALQRDMLAAKERAALLQANNAALEHLGWIGREIAAQLDLDAIFNSLYALLQPLVETPRLVIWLFDADSHTLHLRFRVESGKASNVDNASTAAADSPLLRCLQDHSDIIEQTMASALDDGAKAVGAPVLTELFGALRVRERTLGVLSIGYRDDATNRERHRRLFRTLCAFSAIALDNAAVHARLNQAHLDMQRINAAERQAREDAEQATQLKNTFLSQASETLRRPLDALHRSLLALQDPRLLVDATARHGFLMAALERSRHVNVLARGLLDLARLESGAVTAEIEAFSLTDLVQDLFHDFSARASGLGLHMQMQMAKDLPAVLADIAMTERILSAFVNLSISRSPPDGWIRLSFRLQADEIQIHIEDAGPSWTAQGAVDLFDLKSGAEVEAPGTVVDLLMARRMLVLQERSMRLCTAEGGGLRVEFSLPVAPP